MKQLFILLMSPLMSFYTSGQVTEKIAIVDSIPIHFAFATNKIIDPETVKKRLDSLSTLSYEFLKINAYTDTVGKISYNTILGENRLKKGLELFMPLFNKTAQLNQENIHEMRFNQPFGINDTLFRRVDILAYKKQLNVEYGKPYPLPINFDGNQYFLRTEAKVVINQMIDILERYPTLNIELHGHISGPNSDYPLSLNRTLSVRSYMIEKGIDGERIKAIGFDNTRKLHYEHANESNPLNRRVEIIFIQ